MAVYIQFGTERHRVPNWITYPLLIGASYSGLAPLIPSNADPNDQFGVPPGIEAPAQNFVRSDVDIGQLMERDDINEGILLSTGEYSFRIIDESSSSVVIQPFRNGVALNGNQWHPFSTRRKVYTGQDTARVKEKTLGDVAATSKELTGYYRGLHKIRNLADDLFEAGLEWVRGLRD